MLARSCTGAKKIRAHWLRCNYRVLVADGAREWALARGLKAAATQDEARQVLHLLYCLVNRPW